MENIIKYTTKLVAYNKCVIIPGVGALLAQDIPASYDAEESVFIPPHRKICFNPKITGDASLLLSEYISEKHFSYEEAERQLKKDVGQFNQQLSKKSEICFGSIGIFSMDINREITFAATDNSIDTPFHFGLEPLAIQPLSEVSQKEIVIKRRDLSRYIAVAVAAILAFFFVTPVSDKAYEPNMQASVSILPSRENIAKHIIAEKEQVSDETLYNIAPVEDTVTENIITKTTEDAATAIESNEEIQPTSNIAEKTAVLPVEKIENKPVNKKRHSIIVASSPNAKNAALAIKELSAKHKADYSIVEGNGRYRISINDFDTSQEAANALSEIKNIFPDAWVLTH